MLASDGVRRSVEWAALEEGWRLFERDLGKLQGFIEINATGFRKILKKWDKRSKSDTKEMYLERQVEVQPCFNREFIARLSDVVAANLLDLENGSDHLPKAIFADLPQVTEDGFDPSPGAVVDTSAHALDMDALLDLEANLVKALGTGAGAVNDWLKVAKARQEKCNDDRLMRILWRAALQAPEDQLDTVLSTLHLDFDYVDNINGRSPLHQACIAGSFPLVQLCVENNSSLLERPDSYKRRPIHYAALHGHPIIVSYLLARVDASPTDMDGYTPLMHAIVQGHLDVVRIFVDAKVSLEPTAISADLIPLSLACQFGHLEVARLLLSRGASVIPDSDGLYPQHFAAKAGHHDICQLLVEQGGPTGGGKDKQDKYNLWTPLHHAAVGGEQRHLACIKVLVGAGCDVNSADEYGKSPGWYAAWFGHVECLNYLLASGAKLQGKQSTLDSMDKLGLSADPQMDALSPGSDLDLDHVGGDEFELIPSLSLPPPIIPLRVYGHEFLAQRCQVQLSLGHPFQRTSPDAPRIPPVKLYSRSGQDSLHLWSSLKLVMTSKSDITAVPHSVILPLADEREVFSFQVDDLAKFTLELSLYPTFGSKVIGRAVILPSTFLDIRYHKGFVAPLLDMQLKTIGEVAFQVSCIRPFEEARLEIGGRVETYWKSKVTPSTQGQDHAHSFQTRPLSVSTSDPAAALARPPVGVKPAATKESALVTASSLSGEYVDVVVQVTKDGVPVVYPSWTLPVPDLDIGVADVTFAQFQHLASKNERTLVPPSFPSPAANSINEEVDPTQKAREWYKSISTSLASLDDVLNLVPPEIGLNIQLEYVRATEAGIYHVGKSQEVNEFVDAVLYRIYEAGRTRTGRKIVFSSFDPTVCTALNWKQPNCESSHPFSHCFPRPLSLFFVSICPLNPSNPSRRVLRFVLWHLPQPARPERLQHPQSCAIRPGGGTRYEVYLCPRGSQLCQIDQPPRCHT